jgi:hypothetical protein
MAMLKGRILLNAKKQQCFWRTWTNGMGKFQVEDPEGQYSALTDFSGLYEEGKYV